VAATAVGFEASVGLGGAFLAPIVGGAAIEPVGFEATFLGPARSRSSAWDWRG
jgi:hypothetical protein